MKSKRRTSERRAEASRANGAKSRGPVTERGKYNSSLNSRRYGLLSRFLVLPGEMPELFQEQYDDFMEEHQPRTPTERALVEEMVTSWWRKQRVGGMESARITFQVKLSASMNYAVAANDPATRTALAVGDLADSGRSLDLFLRYETRYERQFHRALARLLDLKSRDPEPDQQAPGVAPPAPAPDILPNRACEQAVDGAPAAAPRSGLTKCVFATGSSEPIQNTPPAAQVCGGLKLSDPTLPKFQPAPSPPLPAPIALHPSADRPPAIAAPQDLPSGIATGCVQ